MGLISSPVGPGINITEFGFVTENNTWDPNGTRYMDPLLEGVTEYPVFPPLNMSRTGSSYSPPHQLVRAVLRNKITPIICVLGFLGNIVNIIVLSRLQLMRTDGARDSGTHLGLIVLAVSDMLFCVAMFPRFLVSEASSIFDDKDFKWFYQMYGTGIVTCFMLTSTWITVVMALMRYVGICHPYSSRKLDGTTFSKIAYFIVFTVCIIFNLPSFFMYKTVALNTGSGTIYILDIGLIDQGSKRGQAFIWAKAIVGILIPMILLSFCNCSLIRALRRSYRMRQQYRVQQTVSSTSNRITLTLIVIMMAFLLLVFPSEIMDLLADNIKKNQAEVFLTVRAFTNVFQIINFAFNFILYCIINVHFRGMLLHMLPCCHRFFPGVLAKFHRSMNKVPSYKRSVVSISSTPSRSSSRRATAETKF